MASFRLHPLFSISDIPQAFQNELNTGTEVVPPRDFDKHGSEKISRENFQLRNLENIDNILKGMNNHQLEGSLPSFVYAFTDQLRKVAAPVIKLVSCKSNLRTIHLADESIEDFVEILKTVIDIEISLVNHYQNFRERTFNAQLYQESKEFDVVLENLKSHLVLIDSLSKKQTLKIHTEYKKRKMDSENTASEIFPNYEDDVIEREFSHLALGFVNSEPQLKELDLERLQSRWISCHESALDLIYQEFMDGYKDAAITGYQQFLTIFLKLEIMKQLKSFIQDLGDISTSSMTEYCKVDGKLLLGRLEEYWTQMNTQILRSVDGWKVPTIVVVGRKKAGKSTLCNIIAGKMANASQVSGGFLNHGSSDGSLDKHKGDDYCFFGNISRPLKLIDTLGWPNSSSFRGNDMQPDIASILKDLKHIHQILLVVDGTDPRIDGTMKSMINHLTCSLTPDIWKNIGIVFSKVPMSKKEIARREKNRLRSDKRIAKDYIQDIKNSFEVDSGIQLDTFYIDAYLDTNDEFEIEAFERELHNLWMSINKRKVLDLSQ